MGHTIIVVTSDCLHADISQLFTPPTPLLNTMLNT